MRFLLKFSHAPGTRSLPTGIRLGIIDAQLRRPDPLFDVPAAARTGFAVGDDSAREHRWYLTDIEVSPALGLDNSRGAWDIAHSLMDERFGADTKLLAV